MIGTNTDGPRGLRRGETGHTKANYEQFEDLLRRLLDFDPETRMKPSEAMEHEFFTNPAHLAASKGEGAVADALEADIDMFEETASKKHAGTASRKAPAEKPVAQPGIVRQSSKRLSEPGSGRRSV